MIRVVCDNCGSDDLCADAYARWNVEKQDWELADVLEYTYCNECGDETSSKEVPLEPLEEAVLKLNKQEEKAA